ncbi:hypothetical protein BJX68DRAFT_260447 [Aspergillus pseudodeflectus]|uniref:Zn(2)-C6 fungal-type domain-containing protein n=1 Tax=Aspergillus pseudodeflectus TaxID=176178 RepID=A0ABR4LAT0_9EURO
MAPASATSRNNSANSTSNTPSYKRGYVACIGCRTRKVRCVLGSKPPCAKCQREHRECVFQKGERTGKRREAPKWARAQGQRDGNSNSTPTPTREDERSDEARSERSRRGSVAEHQDRNPIDDGNGNGNGNLGIHGEAEDSPLTDPVMSTIFTRPSDALDVLFDAARPGPVQEPHGGPFSADGPFGVSSLVSESGLVAVSALSQPSEDVLDLWDKCRFVRQGWFTGQEAVTYLDLLYRYLAPLAPVLTDDYRDHSNHVRLVTEEPMLCCTLLMIASRYFILPGAGGVSRSHFIHQRLWQYCELLIRRIMFGQEKHSTAKTRIVGSIESLILISDWHPRSVHFPPDTEGWDAELISPAYDRRNRVHTNGDVPLIRWREDVFEPARRSERMSWMFLGAATSLAYELGIFDSAGANSSQLSARCHRAASLLYIYVTQMAVKMGCSSLLPENIAVQNMDTHWTASIRLWTELTRLMKTASAMFFQSMASTKQQLGSGQYLILLQHFAPSLDRWHEQFTASSDIPQALGSLILIEYHYLQICTSALSIQAVVERAVARSSAHLGETEGVESCILPQDHTFIRNVVTGSRSVLGIATSMASEGRLRYAPLRTLVCITSSSIFLLKAISLGGRHADLQTSLDILDRCILALRSSGTDDMDFSLRYATLLEKHVARFRANFILPHQPAPFNTGTGALPTSNISQRHDDPLSIPPATPYTHPNSTSMLWPQQQYPSLDQMPAAEDWWARPFDPNIAPFSTHGNAGEGVSLGLELDSLDFLWNLPIVDGVDMPT